jgi:hypothetical protein
LKPLSAAFSRLPPISSNMPIYLRGRPFILISTSLS